MGNYGKKLSKRWARLRMVLFRGVCSGGTGRQRQDLSAADRICHPTLVQKHATKGGGVSVGTAPHVGRSPHYCGIASRATDHMREPVY